MDRLQPWEVPSLIDGLLYTDRNAWEQTRATMGAIYSLFSTKKIKPRDIMAFPWEDAGKEVQQVTDDDIKRLRRNAELIKKSL